MVASCIICVIVALATGSSWSTIATVGIALLGIGKTLGWSEDIVAGAIISGAYCGDKLSPLSDTTNMASGVTATPLFTHIRYMLLTSVPTLVLTLLLFGGIGLTHHPTVTLDEVTYISTTLQAAFWMSPWLLLVPVVVMVLIVQQVPAFPALLIGTLLGGLMAVCCQSSIVLHVAESEVFTSAACYKALIKAMCNPIHAATNDPMLDQLLSSSGTQGMLGTIWLILTAMIFGGVMEATGMLQVVAQGVIGSTHTVGALIASTIGACIFFNLTASDQYLAILLSGKMYAPLYKKAGLASQNLSRALEDGATVTSPLVPWNTCGATQATVLGVATLAYLPYCFFNLLNPLVAIIVGYFAMQVEKTTSFDSNTSGERPAEG
ncbi:MAG: Na+/H+ antiporter NhaC family protein [Roseivirga sp.]